MNYRAANITEDKHCFFGTSGGVSAGKYASLNTNFNSRDDREAIRHNFDIIAAEFAMQSSQMFTVRQGISAVAVYAEQPSWFQQYADGMVTNKQGILLGIKTADCAPILLADYKNGVIGAAHAGWRGALGGIIENVVALMLQKGADVKNIAAAIGPCLQQESFEVKDDLKQQFMAENSDNGKYFLPAADNIHFHFDLSGYAEDKLRRCGIDDICNSGIDTYPEQNGYFSFRRQKHRGLVEATKDYPTQYSCIKL